MGRSLDSRWRAAWSARCRSIGCCSQDVVCRDARVLVHAVALWFGTTRRAMHDLNISCGEELAWLARLPRRWCSNEGQCRRAWLVGCETPLGLSLGLRARAGRWALGVGATALGLAVCTTVAAELVCGWALGALAEVVGPLHACREATVAVTRLLGGGWSALARVCVSAAGRRLGFVSGDVGYSTPCCWRILADVRCSFVDCSCNGLVGCHVCG